MAIANVVLADAATTPVNHTFVPIADGNEPRWINSTGAQTLAGQETLSLSITRSTADKSPHSSRVTLYDPVEVLGTSGTYTVDHASSGDCRFKFAPNSTAQERKDVVRMMKNGLTALEDALSGPTPIL